MKPQVRFAGNPDQHESKSEQKSFQTRCLWWIKKKLKKLIIIGLLLALALYMTHPVGRGKDVTPALKTSGSRLTSRISGIKELGNIKDNDLSNTLQERAVLKDIMGVDDKDFHTLKISTSRAGDIDTKELIGINSKAVVNKDLDLTLKFNDETVLKGKLNRNKLAKVKPIDCSKESKTVACYEWINDARFSIGLNRSDVLDMDCFDFEWTALRCVDQVFSDCFEIGSTHWYGGYQNKQQYWPLSRNVQTSTAFVSHDINFGPIGDVLERYFFSSKGTGIYIDSEVPFYFGMNDPQGLMCITAKYGKVWYNNYDNKYPVLKYKICQSDSVKSIHSKMASMFIDKPTDIPAKKLFQYPIWSTWAEFRKDINQSAVLQFAKEILAHNFSHAQLEIDDFWTPTYGDYEFDGVKFSNATNMIRQLNDVGFRVTVWVHPFFNIDSKSFAEGASKKYFIQSYNSTRPALIKWWRGQLAAILDPTNPNATSWYLKKLKNLKRVYNISSFKFDAGEAGFLPPVFSSFQTKMDPNDIYPNSYVEMAVKADLSRRLEVRAGYRTQKYPVFVRIMDKYSQWGHENGIKSVIPVILTFGILGYPFVLPDMIAGNLKSMNDPELYVRWVELNAFLPGMQFSLVPWKFDKNTIKVAQKFTKLHEQFAPVFIKLAQESTMNGYPIIRPLWWIDPNSEDALTCEDEFLVGNEILVAPVVEPGARSRDIYLPPGAWNDHLRNTKLQGPLWLRNYRVELDELAYFISAI